MIELSIVLIVALVVGFLAGWKFRESYAKFIVKQIMHNKLNTLTESVMNIEVVKANQQFYIYNSATNAFIVQVKSKEELFDYFADKYPEKTVMMKKEHLELFESV